MTNNLNSGKRISFLFAGSWSLSEDATVNILFLNKIALTWLSHLNGKQGKGRGRFVTKKSMSVCATSCSLTEHLWWSSKKPGPVSRVFLPPLVSGLCPCLATEARSALVTGPGDLESPRHDWQHYQSNTHQPQHHRAGCHLENSWGPDTGVTPSSSTVVSVMWSDQWNSHIKILYSSIHNNDKLIHGCSGKFALS